jgi:chromosome segregation protein
MRIKRVVIHGFKTFARKTEFIFDPGVTAVVGPNGSGKSNIVDAVRWCLGEQSFSLLRSKKTSDVIFSGSDKKARLGMAEVRITLDNSAGEIPIDFAEVEISRRAYRDGDNEYLVNGQRVRLQDVVELLAQTGLGKRTYSVVGQGLIDRALSMAPEERRSLFEEAAGITGYQAKRATSLRRLEVTEQNLTRVRDIVAELSPRLGYMRRQADRAREREQLARDLQALLREWYGFRWHTTLRNLESHHAEEQAAKAAAAARQELLGACTAQIDELRLRQSALRNQLADLHGSGSQLHRQAESVGRELAVTQERQRQTLARREDAERELAPLRGQLATLVDRFQELQAAVAALAAEVATRQQAVDVTHAEVSARQQERAQAQATVDAARIGLQQAQQRRIELHSRITQLDERRLALTTNRTQHATALAAANADAERTGAALADAERTAGAAEAALAAAQAAVAELETAIAAQRAELRSAEQQRQETDRALDRLQTRFDLLNRLREDGAGYAGGVRTVLQAGRSGGALRGVLGTVASLVRVPPHLDKAIETALGGALQNVVVERWQDATAAIELLKQQRGGRATFLPLDRLNTLPAIAAPRAAGILGNAFDLVEFDRAVAPALEQLLNRIWIAEDLPAARAALDAGGGPRPTVVTLAGEIVRPGGAVTGGSDSTRGDDSLLTRERELRELPGAIAKSRQTAQAAAAVCAAVAQQIETAGVELQQRQSAVSDLVNQEKARRRELDELRRQADRARQVQQFQAERLVQVDAEAEQLSSQRTMLEQELADAEARQADAAAALAAAETALAGMVADALLQELANRRAALAEVQGRSNSQQSLADNTARNRQALEEQIARKERQIADLDAEAERLSAQIAGLSERDSGLNRQLASLQAEIDPIEAEMSVLEQRLESEEQQERHLQQLLRKEEGVWNAAQLQLQRGEDALFQLRHEIEQDLGLVTLEQSADIAYQPPLPWDAFVEQLPVVESVPEAMEGEVRDSRTRLARLGNVNPEAPREYEEAAGRYEFLSTQAEDLEAAASDLRQIIAELDQRMQVELRRTFDAVAREFTHFFQQLFNGGTAHLELTDPENIGASGIEIIARPPGKRPQSLALLSGGERALAACALIFAILRVSPTPFCVLDEVDAALDEANIDRFRTTLETLSDETQFIIVTHNRRTLEGANTIYGVTMGDDGISQVMSLRLEGDRILNRAVDAEVSAEAAMPL